MKGRLFEIPIFLFSFRNSFFLINQQLSNKPDQMRQMGRGFFTAQNSNRLAGLVQRMVRSEQSVRAWQKARDRHREYRGNGYKDRQSKYSEEKGERREEGNQKDRKEL